MSTPETVSSESLPIETTVFDPPADDNETQMLALLDHLAHLDLAANNCVGSEE